MLLIEESRCTIGQNERKLDFTGQRPSGCGFVVGFSGNLSTRRCSNGLWAGIATRRCRRLGTAGFPVRRESNRGWEPDSQQPPFRVWLARITRNAIVNALTRRKPDAGGGSTSVQEMLRELPERNDETTQRLMEESRREAIRWATEEIQSEFTEVTWAMFWLTSIEGESVAEVARRQNKRPAQSTWLASK